MIKKLFLILVFVLISSQVWAAGACVENTSGAYNGSDIRWKTYTCTADAAAGTYATLTITGFVGYYLYTIETWPGTTAPTDASDYTLLDATKSISDDLMGGEGANGIDATTAITRIPATPDGTQKLFHLIKGNLTFVPVQEAVVTNSAIFYMRITGVK